MENNVKIIENLLSKDSCDFIIDSFKDSFNHTNNNGIFAGPGHSLENAWQVGNGRIFYEYSEESNKNISVDMITNVLINIKNIMSEHYKDTLDFKTIFYGKMIPGSKLEEHYDNYDKDGSFYFSYGTDPNIIKQIGLEPDYSAIFYLNDSYSGGEIEFPDHKLKLKPKPGTLIFFKGDMNFPHFVNEVITGNRYNLVLFLWRSEYRKKYFNLLVDFKN